MCTNKSVHLWIQNAHSHRPNVRYNTRIVLTVTCCRPSLSTIPRLLFSFEMSTSKCLSRSSGIVDLRLTLVECLLAQWGRRRRIHFTSPYISAVSSRDTVQHWEERQLRTQPSLMAFLLWKEAIIKVKWADAERKAFFVMINVVLNLTPQAGGTLSKWPRGPCHFYSTP